MHGRKRTTEKVRKDGLQEGLARIQENQEENGGEAEKRAQEEIVKDFFETLYKAFKPLWGC